jgi:glycosyltransferase involved in cell wall biosynthesis
MRISVIIPSRNRGVSLERTLDTIVSPENLRSDDWELIVINNCSTDNTGEVCAKYARLHPSHVQALSCSTPGRSNALNTGLVHATGEVIAFTDDDVLCAPGYLDGVRSTFADNSIDAAQGRVFLDFEGPRPAWFDDEVATMFGLSDFGDAAAPLTRNIFGLNMLVRRSVIERIGGFSPSLGVGTPGGFREDSEFSRRIFAAGFQVVYTPGVVVRHQIVTERLDPHHVVRRCFGDARAEAYLVKPEVPLWRYSLYVAKLAATTNWRSSMHDRRYLWSRAGFLWQHLLFKFHRPSITTGVCLLPVSRGA